MAYKTYRNCHNCSRICFKLDVLAVVIVSGIETGLVSGLDIIEILRIWNLLLIID